MSALRKLQCGAGNCRQRQLWAERAGSKSRTGGLNWARSRHSLQARRMTRLGHLWQMAFKARSPTSVGFDFAVTCSGISSYIPVPGPRLRPNSQEIPLPRTRPETCRPNAFSMTGRQGTSVKSFERSIKGVLAADELHGLPLVCADALAALGYARLHAVPLS